MSSNIKNFTSYTDYYCTDPKFDDESLSNIQKASIINRRIKAALVRKSGIKDTDDMQTKIKKMLITALDMTEKLNETYGEIEDLDLLMGVLVEMWNDYKMKHPFKCYIRSFLFSGEIHKIKRDTVTFSRFKKVIKKYLNRALKKIDKMYKHPQILEPYFADLRSIWFMVGFWGTDILIHE